MWPSYNQLIRNGSVEMMIKPRYKYNWKLEKWDLIGIDHKTIAPEDFYK